MGDVSSAVKERGAEGRGVEEMEEKSRVDGSVSGQPKM